MSLSVEFNQQTHEAFIVDDEGRKAPIPREIVTQLHVWPHEGGPSLVRIYEGDSGRWPLDFLAFVQMADALYDTLTELRQAPREYTAEAEQTAIGQLLHLLHTKRDAVGQELSSYFRRDIKVDQSANIVIFMVDGTKVEVPEQVLLAQERPLSVFLREKFGEV